MRNLSNIYKLLSDETRLRLILLLRTSELCVCELTGVLDISQPKISKSLSKLRDLDLVEDYRKEKFVFYRLKEDNKVFLGTLDVILENLSDYPQLVEDLIRLNDKEKYLSSCSIEALNRLT